MQPSWCPASLESSPLGCPMPSLAIQQAWIEILLLSYKLGKQPTWLSNAVSCCPTSLESSPLGCPMPSLAIQQAWKAAHLAVRCRLLLSRKRPSSVVHRSRSPVGRRAFFCLVLFAFSRGGLWRDGRWIWLSRSINVSVLWSFCLSRFLVHRRDQRQALFAIRWSGKYCVVVVAFETNDR